MTVGELIEVLKSYDSERLVVLSSDAEGNGYAPLRKHWDGSYDDGEAGCEAGNIPEGYDSEDVVDGAPALVLTP
ncbi:MAG: hypothetical protein ACPG4T_18265 [Nannocystaceae bacterium]